MNPGGHWDNLEAVSPAVGIHPELDLTPDPRHSSLSPVDVVGADRDGPSRLASPSLRWSRAGGRTTSRLLRIRPGR